MAMSGGIKLSAATKIEHTVLCDRCSKLSCTVTADIFPSNSDSSEMLPTKTVFVQKRLKSRSSNAQADRGAAGSAAHRVDVGIPEEPRVALEVPRSTQRANSAGNRNAALLALGGGP